MDKKKLGVVAVAIALILIVLVSYVTFQPSPPTPLSQERRVPELTLLSLGPSFDPVRHDSILMLAKNWEQLGIKTNVVVVADLTAYYDKARKPPYDFDAMAVGFVTRAERIDPDPMLTRLISANAIGGGDNFGGWMNASYDKLVMAQQVETDPIKRNQLVQDAQVYLAQDVPALWLFHVVGRFAYNVERFSGWVSNHVEGPYNVWTMVYASALTSDATLRVGYQGELSSVNPLAGSIQGDLQFYRLVYDTLAKIDTKGQGVPWAAKSWTSPDPTTIIVTLRDGMKFHDGRPVTADDVVFSYNYMTQWSGKTTGSVVWASSLKPIKSVEALDSSTVKFTLNSPYPAIYVTTFTQIYILPKHIWVDVVEREKLTSPDQFKNTPAIGSGPFKFNYYTRGVELSSIANKDHFAAPKVNFLYRFYTSADAVFAALQAKEIDTNDLFLLPAHMEAVKNLPHLKAALSPDVGAFFVALNVRRYPFADLNMRRALAHTIDYNYIVNVLLKGYGMQGMGLIAPANVLGHNPKWEQEWTKTIYNFDTNKAKEMLKGAGYQWGSDGALYYPPGLPKAVTTTAGSLLPNPVTLAAIPRFRFEDQLYTGHRTVPLQE